MPDTNNKKEEVAQLLNKCECGMKKALAQAAELQRSLCNPIWLGKYMGDPIVITTYSETVRKLRSAAAELKKSVIFLKNRMELKNVENLFDDRMIENLKKLNTNVESQIDKTLSVN